MLFTLAASCTDGFSKPRGRELFKYQAGICWSPEYSFHRLMAASGGGELRPELYERERSESGKYSSSAGFYSRIQVAGSWYLETGIYFSEKGYRTAPRPVPGGAGTTETFCEDYSFRFVSIPFMASCYRGSGKIYAGIAGGIEAAFYSGEKNLRTFSGGRAEEEFYAGRDINSVLLSARFSVSANWRIDRRLTLSVSPTLVYGLSTIKTPSVNEKLHSIGLPVGLSYSF
jgi:hypothetical protein